MTDKILPCACGYEGELSGASNGFWYQLHCPKCGTYVEAFTPSGLAALWNEKQLGIEREPMT